jgi:hypothetical protein
MVDRYCRQSASSIHVDMLYAPSGPGRLVGRDWRRGRRPVDN